MKKKLYFKNKKLYYTYEKRENHWISPVGCKIWYSCDEFGIVIGFKPRIFDRIYEKEGGSTYTSIITYSGYSLSAVVFLGIMFGLTHSCNMGPI
jgi:hypothetical protein